MQQLLTEKAAKIVSTLTERKMTIAAAESCTGGLVSSLITAVSGASSVFGLGMCSYAANAKINNLGVNAETIEKRLAKAEYEISFADKFDKVVINDDLESAKAEALSIIKEFIEK